MKQVVFLIALSAVLFSTMEVALKIAVVGVDPFQMTFVRFFWGGIVLLPFAYKELKKRSIHLVKKDMIYFVILGIINIVVSMSFFQFAVIYAKASTVAVIFCTNPMFTMLFAHFITEEKLTKKKVVAVFLSIIGLAFIMNPLYMERGNNFIGIMLAFSSSVTFGLYSAYGKRKIQQFGGMLQTSVSFLLGSGALLMILLVMQRPIIKGITSDNLLLIFYISIMVTGIGYLAYFLIMEKANTAYASLVFFIKPALAPIIAMWVFKELITWNVIVGIIFILAGSYITLGTKRLMNKS